MLDVLDSHRERLNEAWRRLQEAFARALSDYDQEVVASSLAMNGATRARLEALRGSEAGAEPTKEEQSEVKGDLNGEASEV